MTVSYTHLDVYKRQGWAGQVYGYLSSALSDQDGLFMKGTVKLSCTRNGGAISVLTICFDPAANEYAVDFDVTIRCV